MSNSRQVRRANARKIKKQASQAAKQKGLAEHCAELTQVVAEMQISMNALYEVLVSKGVLNHQELLSKHNALLERLRNIRAGKSVQGQPSPEKQSVDQPVSQPVETEEAAA